MLTRLDTSTLPRAAQLWAAIIVSFAAAACDRPTCLGMHPATDDRNAPVLARIELLQQPDTVPWMLMMAVDFTDRDGDSGNGNMLVYVGAGAPVSMPLADYFETSELDLSSTSGRFGLPLFINQGAVQGDTVLRLGFQMQDEREHYSNCYAMDLVYDVTAATGAAAASPNTKVALKPRKVMCP